MPPIPVSPPATPRRSLCLPVGRLGSVLALALLAGVAAAAPAVPPRPASLPTGPTSLQTGAPPGLAPAVVSVPHPAPLAVDAHRWTDETPDAMVDDARARAIAATATDADVVAALLTIEALADRASWPRAQQALREIATARAHAADAAHTDELGGEVALVARSLAPDEGSDAGTAADAKLGILTNLAILAPFRDTGGGLRAKEGPEAAGASFGDMRARYSWGTIDVGWRAIPPHYAGARGVPLDVFVHPRKESCSIVASKITVRSAGPIVVRLAASGSARLMFDGVEVERSEDVHTSAKLDRMAAEVQARVGDHLVAAKVCTGALDDDGRIRLRVTDPSGAPLELTSSATLRDPPARTKVSARRRRTALDRTLSPAGGPGTAPGVTGKAMDVELDAIVARITGGADDLKSPRAPGMLDLFTRLKDVDADRLAMAGWIAPSGANRSGWLNLARARAAATGDARTRTFVDRRLAAEHIAARMPDWAMATRADAKIDAGDAEGTMLDALVDQALGTDALRARALATLTKAADAAPATVPTALLQELAQLASVVAPHRELAVRRLLERRGEGGLELVNAASSDGAKAVAQAALAALEDAAIADIDDGVSIAQAVAKAGDHDTARTLFARLVQWGPNVPNAWAGLADEIAATATAPSAATDRSVATDTDRSESVSAALRRARALSPGEARYRAELSLRAEANNPEGREDERYLVPSQTILARRQGVPAGLSDVADRELYWLRAVVMHPDRRVSQLIQYGREIVIAPRTEEELLEDLPAEGEQTEILRARVHRKDGGTAFPTEEHNEGTRPRIRWPELLPGDTVEVAVRTWTAGAVGGRSDPPFYFLDYSGAQQTHPLLYNEVVVDAPIAVPIHVDALHGDPDRREDKDENGRHVTHIIWDRPPVFADEPLAPALAEHVPMTVGSTFKTWGDFRAWYNEAIRDFTVPDAEVRRLAAELTRGKTTKDQRVRALFNFVADDIRYVNYVSGEQWLPNRPQQLLARREGDCDDKAVLLITLLRAIGVEAQEVLLQTRETGQPSLITAKNAAIPMFDHGIAFLPGPGGGTYLDATSPQSRLGPLPSMDARAVALRIDSGPAEIVRLPSSSPDDHGATVSWTLTLHADGSGELAGEENHTGDGAFWLRTYLTEEGGSRAQYVENNLVGNWFPTVDVDKKVEFKGDLPNGQAWVRYHAHSDGFARHEQGELVLPLAQSGSLAMQLAPLVRRTLPISLGSSVAPSHQTRTTRIVAPAGFVWSPLPPGGDENGGDFGRAHLEVAKDPRDPRVVVVKRSLVFDQHLIPVDRYKPWREWLQRVDALMHKSVRLLPVAPEGGGR
jgi:hypothetical protein